MCMQGGGVYLSNLSLSNSKPVAECFHPHVKGTSALTTVKWH